MSNYLDIIWLQSEIRSLVDDFQEKTGLRVSAIDIEDHGFDSGKPVLSKVTVITEEPP
jgi:hypothetical protein